VRPLAFEHRVGRSAGTIPAIAFVVQGLETDAAAPLEGRGLGIGIDQESLQRRQQERPEAAAFRIGTGVPCAFQETREERLREVFRGIDRVATAAHECQHGRPVCPAQLFQRRARFEGLAACAQHHTPACRLEPPHPPRPHAAGQATGVRLLRRHYA
jgi:hypothetical protein